MIAPTYIYQTRVDPPKNVLDHLYERKEMLTDYMLLTWWPWYLTSSKIIKWLNFHIFCLENCSKELFSQVHKSPCVCILI